MILQGYPFFSGGPYNNTIRWCMPLTTPKKHFLKALHVLMQSIEVNEDQLRIG